MKRVLTYLTGSIFALALASAAQAQAIDPTTKVIHITGSTAYRGQTLTAISAIFDGAFSVGYVGGGAYNGTGAANLRGNINGVDVLIKASFSGSEAGLQTVSFGAAPLTVKFLPDSATRAGTGAAHNGTQGGGGLTDPTTASDTSLFSPDVPDIAMSDTFQAKSEFFGDFKGKNYPALQESPNSPVGVVPFVFVISKTGATSSGITNITTQLAKNLFSAGKVQTSVFTGITGDPNNASDPNRKYVFAIGRDPDSGTRLTALAETGLGAAAFVKQYQPLDGTNAVISAAGATVAINQPWPLSTVNTISVPVFNGGYNSGGKLAGAMGAATDNMANKDNLGNALSGDAATGGWYITYLSTSDAANTAIPAGAAPLAYNGVSIYDTQQSKFILTKLTEGQYTFWGYEHLSYRTSANATVKAVGDKIALQLQTTDAAVLLNAMKVGRTTDGATVQ